MLANLLMRGKRDGSVEEEKEKTEEIIVKGCRCHFKRLSHNAKRCRENSKGGKASNLFKKENFTTHRTQESAEIQEPAQK